jgi:hypothetical protein
MSGRHRPGMLQVEPPHDRRSCGLLHGRAGRRGTSRRARQPVDRARPVENAQNAFPTRSLENRAERGFPHAPQAYSFTLMKNNKGRTMMRPNS